MFHSKRNFSKKCWCCVYITFLNIYSEEIFFSIHDLYFASWMKYIDLKERSLSFWECYARKSTALLCNHPILDRLYNDSLESWRWQDIWNINFVLDAWISKLKISLNPDDYVEDVSYTRQPIRLLVAIEHWSSYIARYYINYRSSCFLSWSLFACTLFVLACMTILESQNSRIHEFEDKNHCKEFLQLCNLWDFGVLEFSIIRNWEF